MREVLKEDKMWISVCVEENRENGEIKKTKGEENVVKKKLMKKKGVVLVLCVKQEYEQILRKNGNHMKKINKLY